MTNGQEKKTTETQLKYLKQQHLAAKNRLQALKRRRDVIYSDVRKFDEKQVFVSPKKRQGKLSHIVTHPSNASYVRHLCAHAHQLSTQLTQTCALYHICWQNTRFTDPDDILTKSSNTYTYKHLHNTPPTTSHTSNNTTHCHGYNLNAPSSCNPPPRSHTVGYDIDASSGCTPTH